MHWWRYVDKKAGTKLFGPGQTVSDSKYNQNDQGIKCMYLQDITGSKVMK